MHIHTYIHIHICAQPAASVFEVCFYTNVHCGVFLHQRTRKRKRGSKCNYQTKKLFGRNPDVMYTRETCGQRSTMAAWNKRALAFHFSVFSVWIWYVFPTSYCRGKWDLDLYTTCGFTHIKPLRSGDFRKKLRSNTLLNCFQRIHVHKKKCSQDSL